MKKRKIKKQRTNVKKNYTIEDIHVPSAESKRDMVEYKALINALNEIEKAKQAGKYHCYVTCDGYAPRAVIQKLIDAGYDLSYSYFKHSNSWFVKAYWMEGCSGKIYKENTIGRGEYVSIDEMFQI